LKRLLLVAVLFTIGLTAFATAGTAIYRWLEDGDKVSCVANEFSFGCSSILGWVLSAVGVAVFVGAIYLWERFRGN
jgi:hypothetical protein